MFYMILLFMQILSIKNLVVLIVILALVACGNQPTQPKPQTSIDISQFIDPSLRPEDQDAYMAVLETLGPDALGNLTFINTEEN
jgi:hypothetical protein